MKSSAHFLEKKISFRFDIHQNTLIELYNEQLLTFK